MAAAAARSNSDRQAEFLSVTTPLNNATTTHYESLADSRRTLTDGRREVSACLSDLSVHGGAVGAAGPRDVLPVDLSSSSCPPAYSSSSSPFSLDKHDTTSTSSLISSLKQTARPAPAHAPRTSVAAALRARKVPRRQYRLDSAQARRTVVAKQRHRKLLELKDSSLNDAPVPLPGEHKKSLADQEQRLCEIAEDGNVGWMAASSSSSPSSTPVCPDRGGSEPASSYSAPTRAPLSHSLNSIRASHPSTLSDGSLGGSGAASLTSLQRRLWQHTITNVTAAHTTGAGGTWAKSRPCSLPPSPPPPPLPGLSRTAAATIRQGRQGQYTSVPPPALTPAKTVESSGGALVPTSLTSLSLLTSSAQVPVPRWEESLMGERARGRQGVLIAQWLVHRLLTTPPSIDLDRSRYASFTTATATSNIEGDRNAAMAVVSDGVSVGECIGADEHGGGDGGLLRSLSERAAVAAYLLSSLVEDGLPRHQQSVVPYVRMLIEFAFVSDTPAIRTALGTDTVQDEELLDRLAVCDRCSIPLTATTAMTFDLIDLLAPSFTRKTYITAHFELSSMTVGLAHEVRCQELHQRNVPRLLERTHKNWMRGLIRAVLRAWRHLCHERRVQELRQRARWAQRWTSERMRISLRRWRGYAALTLQTAEADSVAKAALSEKRALIKRLEDEAAAMQRASQQLQVTLQRQDEDREVVEATIAEREVVYQRLLRQVREVDRVGSLMLHSLLLNKAPPRYDAASTLTTLPSLSVLRNGSLPSATVAATPRRSVSDSDSTDNGDEDDEPQPPHAVTALPTLLQWAKDCCKAVEEAYLALYPNDVEAVSGDGGTDKEADERKRGTADSGAAKSVRHSPHSPLHISRAGSRRSPRTGEEDTKEAAPTHSPLDFDALLSSPTSAVSLVANASLGETVLLPLHKLLLLMRGCSGLEDNGACDVDGDVVDAAALTGQAANPSNLDALTAALDSAANAQDVKGGGVADAVVPSFGMIRTIHSADAGILKEAYALLNQDNGALITDSYPMSSPHAATSTSAVSSAAVATATATSANTVSEGEGGADLPSSPSGLSLLLRLSPEKRDTLQRVCRVVVNAYEQLTGTACVVSAEQLFERSRGTLLVFLAALMRHYTNWMVRRTQQVPPATTPTTTTAAAAAPTLSPVPSEDISSSAVAAATATGKRERKTDSEGAAHERYNEWSHPPHSHRRWRGQVRRQAGWIALSFSALHEAVCVATVPSRVLTVGQQDHVSGLLEQLSLTEFIDLLPSSADQTMQCYVSMVGAVERFAPSLHLLFHQFALPLAQLRADGGSGVAATAKPQQRRSLSIDCAGSAEKELYVTANTVWRLLCLTGLAGDPSEAYCTTVSRVQSEDASAPPHATVTPPFAATLHRHAVYSLVEQVTQHGVSSTSMSLRRGSTRLPGGAAGSGTSAEGNSGAEGRGSAAVTSPLVRTVSCKTRPRPCYARALREGRHVDLRADTGAVCVNYAQFVKVLIRLAHAWQCQQQQREEEEQEAELRLKKKEEGDDAEAEAKAGAAKAGDGGKEAGSAEEDEESITIAAAAGSTVSPQRKDGAPTSTAQEVTKSSSRRTSSTCGAAGATATSTGLSARVEYEAGNYAHTLSLPYFHIFFGELLLPRLLGANRWCSAAERAMCSRPVLQLFAQYHDALVDVFNNYQRPHEARGVRASLPPPYSTVLASQLFSQVVDAERQARSGLTVGGGRSMSHVQRASLMYSLNGSNALFLDEDDNDDVDGGSSEKKDRRRRTQSQRRRSSVSQLQRGSLAASHVTVEESPLKHNLRASLAVAQRTDVSIVSVLQWTDIVTLAKDMRWFSIRRLSEEALWLCFRHTRADPTREGDTVFFAEFLQLLCTVSYYASASPAVPLEVKLKGFLESYVFSTLN